MAENAPQKVKLFEQGDKIPYATVLHMVNGEPCPILNFIGSPFVLFYFLKTEHALSNQLLTEFKAACEDFKKMGIGLYGVCPEPPIRIQKIMNQSQAPYFIFSDEGFVLGRELGVATSELLGDIERVEAKPIIFLIDGTLRARQVIVSKDPQAEIQKLLKEAPALLAYREPAPILKVPLVFSQEFCQNLLDVWQKTKKGEGDKVPEPTRALLAESIDFYLATRILPCLQSAFGYKPIFREPPRLWMHSELPLDKVLKANGGKDFQYRDFAVMIPLKMESEEGVELEFVEYGPTSYHVSLGEALVFSADLLHRYLASKKGDVYWFVTFFHREKIPSNVTPLNKASGDLSSDIPDALF